MSSGYFTRSFAAALAVTLGLFCGVSSSSAAGPVYVGDEVTFTDLSTGDPYLHVWDFDYDGILPLPDSLDQNPTWTFQEAGVYRVYLEACNLNGCGTVDKNVVVLDAPDLIFRDGVESGDFSAWTFITGGS